MLNQEEKELLQKEVARIQKVNERIAGALLPEDKELLEREYPSGGIHKHDANNPFGMHRHHLGDPIDGAHTHTAQNPGGEHVHGEFQGKALIDGKHYHEGGDLGHHYHRDHHNYGETVPQEAPKVV